MPRKQLEITISAEGRDKGKTFVITELPASQGEKWATRALLALSRSGIDMPEEVAGMGMAGIAYVGLKALAGVQFAEAGPLMDEMFTCVSLRPDAARPEYLRPPMEDEIQEIGTRATLRMEVLTLHTGFSIAGALQKFLSQLKTPAPPLDIPTSPPPSEQ